MFSRATQFIGRLGMAFCFLSFGIWELVQANYWTAYVPSFISSSINPILLVHVHGIILTIVGLGVLIGLYPRLFTGLSVLIMLEIVSSVISAEGFSDILIRDIAILFFAVALFVDAYQTHKKVVQVSAGSK